MKESVVPSCDPPSKKLTRDDALLFRDRPCDPQPKSRRRDAARYRNQLKAEECLAQSSEFCFSWPTKIKTESLT
jgi:hypothetical protein